MLMNHEPMDAAGHVSRKKRRGYFKGSRDQCIEAIHEVHVDLAEQPIRKAAPLEQQEKKDTTKIKVRPSLPVPAVHCEQAGYPWSTPEGFRDMDEDARRRCATTFATLINIFLEARSNPMKQLLPRRRIFLKLCAPIKRTVTAMVCRTCLWPSLGQTCRDEGCDQVLVKVKPLRPVPTHKIPLTMNHLRVLLLVADAMTPKELLAPFLYQTISSTHALAVAQAGRYELLAYIMKNILLPQERITPYMEAQIISLAEREEDYDISVHSAAGHEMLAALRAGMV